MYVTCVRHRVKDFAHWKKAFDHNAELLFERFGVLSTSIVQIGGDPTDVAVINTWPSQKHWDDFVTGHAEPEYAGKLKGPKDGGVVGEVEFWGGEVV